MQKRIDSLEEDADSSSDRESYRLFFRSGLVRIRIGCCKNGSAFKFFVEVSISIPFNGNEVDLDQLDRIIQILKQFKDSGYEVWCQDEPSFICEKACDRSSVERELFQTRQRARELC